MKFAYSRDGRPLLSWRGGTAPQGTRAADAKALGSLGGSSLGGTSITGPTLELPKAGAPEPLGGCACKPGMGDPFSMNLPWGHPPEGQFVQAVSGFADRVTALPLPAKIAGAAALFLLYRHMKKRK